MKKSIKIALCSVAFVVVTAVTCRLFRRKKTSVDALSKETDTKKLTYSQSWYLEAAEKLYTAMDGIGTNFSIIKSVLEKLKNKDDWNNLKIVYGKKKSSWGFNAKDQSLVDWLVDDCSESEIKIINKILQNIDAQQI